jgi:putative YphP/YqiW family bacilliredoxin
MPPLYAREDVQPMIDELTNVGVASLSTPEAVDEAVLHTPGVSLVVINSVCGCAAGNCRPGVTLALQNEKIPDTLGTVFAGVDTEAVDRARALMSEVPPSSPCIAMFKDGKLIGVLERRHIEQMTAVDIGNALSKAFNEHCDRQGPSVPKEVFEKNEHVDRCGSSIPIYQGD